jgi:hypothetical protein
MCGVLLARYVPLAEHIFGFAGDDDAAVWGDEEVEDEEPQDVVEEDDYDHNSEPSGAHTARCPVRANGARSCVPATRVPPAACA